MENAEIELLVTKVQKDSDTEAFSQLYDHFVKQVYRYVFFKVTEAEVEDIVENTFIKGWENIAQYHVQEKKSFAAWLFRIAHNLIVDHYRTSSAKLEERLHEFTDILQDERTEHNPLKMTNRELNKTTVRSALGKLSDHHRQIIQLKFLNELENSEIAEVLGKSEGSLRILQHRALKALKDVLTEMGFHA